jgi:pentose-5-phosphate-3-epimerase
VRAQCEIHRDGGIDPATAPAAVAQWACVLVAGSAIFGAPLGIRSAIDRLQTSMTTDGVDERRQGCRWA